MERRKTKGFFDLLHRKPKEQEKKVKGGEEKGVMIEGIGATDTGIDTRRLVLSCSS